MKTHIISLVLALLSAPALAGHPALEQTLERARALRAEGKTPVVVTDLDETVIDSTARRFQSIQDAIREACGPDRSAACARAAGLNSAEIRALPNRYDLSPLFRAVGIEDAAFIDGIDSGSLPIYLSNRWMRLDEAVPGATEFIRALRAADTRVFFVTSRWRSRQQRGTLASLEHLGMIEEDEEEFVILRPDGMSSIEFKKASFARVSEWVDSHDGEVIGVFENEPENLNAMRAEFPDAIQVFVEGAFLGEEELEGCPARIHDFR